MYVKQTPNSTPDELASQGKISKHLDSEIDSSTAAVTPVLAQSVEAVRDKLLTSGISEKDVADATAWARRPKE